MTSPTQQEHTMTQLDIDTARLVSKLADLQARIADLNSEAEAVKAELRSLSAGDYAFNGRKALSIVPTRRFDVAGAAGLLSPEQREAAQVVTFDAAKVKQHLTGVEIEEFMVVNGKPKVVLA